MDGTLPQLHRQPVSRAMLVTSNALGASNIGFCAGIFSRVVGHLSPYAATATGFSSAVTAFGIGMAIAAFVRKGNDA